MLHSVIFVVALLLSPALAAAEMLRVYVTVAPLTWLVAEVGGERVAVKSLVKAGQDPHGFEPSPRQVSDLQQADVYLSLDLPFERAWLPRLAGQNPDLRVVSLVKQDHAAHAHPGDSHGHGRAEKDPHVWTDPQQMVAMSEQVRDLLAGLVPDAADEFAARQAVLAARLEVLDKDLAERFARMQAKVFLVHHPAWGHLASRYGLVQLAIEQDGKEPGPKTLGALSAQVRRHGIRTLFVEPQASDHLAHGLASTLGLEVVELDPLAADYERNLRRVAERIAEGVR